MRLISIELRNYRGVEHSFVEFVHDGVTIVEGPNEIGKSSLAEAMDRLFEDMDSTSRRRVLDTRPVGRDVGPEVAVEAETGPYRFRYRKRFLRDRTTELDVLEPKPEHHTGRDAHERVLTILAETVDLPLWKALRMQQGGAINQAGLLEQTSLSAALDRAAGEAPAGEDEKSLFGMVRREYLEYWTETGRRKQEAVELDRSIEQAEETIRVVDETLFAMERDVDAVARLEGERKRLNDRQEEQRDAFREHEDRVRLLSELENSAERLEAQFDVARVLADQSRRAKAERHQAIESVREAAELAKQHESDLDASVPAFEAAQARLEEGQERLSAAVTRRTEAKSRAFESHAAQARLQRTNEAAELQRRLDRVTAATTRIEEARDAASLSIDQARLDSIRAQDRDVVVAQARLEAGQPKISIDAASDLHLSVDGEAVDLGKGEAWERHVVGALEVSIDDLITIIVSIEGGNEHAEALEQARRALAETYGQAGAADLVEAERLYRRKIEAVQVIGEQRRIRTENLDGMTSESLEMRLLSLNAEIGDLGVSAEQKAVSDEMTVRTTTDAADRELEEAEQSVRESDQEVESARIRSTELREGRIGLATEQRIGLADLERREKVLVEERDLVSDADLETQLRAAEASEQEHEHGLIEAQAEVAREGLAQARDALENAKQAVARVDVEVRQVEDELIEVRTRLRDHGEDGLAEDRDTAVSTRDYLQARRERYKSRAGARKLLYETLRDERDAARRAYVKPLRQQIENLGSYVFGTDFAVELDDQDLRVLSRTIHGRTVPFESLSVGAQEQIALISRLSCATIVAPDGGVPVILDDALGNSDPQRLEAMGAVLAVAGRLCQIIVLTCQPDRYRHVGSASVVRL